MKELSEHLRTVHFTVLVVALILIAASQIEGRRPLEKAAADAEAISRLRQKWGETAAKIRQAADSAVPAMSIQVGGHPGIALSNGTNYRLRTPRGAVFNFSLTREDPRSSLGIGTELVLAKWIYFSSDAPDGEMPLNRFPKPWSTLKQFLTVWDDLLLGRAVFLPFQLMQDDSNRCGVIGPREFLDGRDTAVVDPNPHRVGDFWELRPILKSEIGAPVCQFFPTNVKALKLDFVEIYSAVLGRSIGWGERTSSEEFPEIIEAAKYFEDAPIDRLATALRSRASTDVERIDLFQAKLPADVVQRYGGVVLILCQFYLLAHLIELHRFARETPRINWPTGYIGLYDNVATFAFTIFSVAILPVLPSILTLRTRTHQSLIVWATLVLSITIGLLSAVILIMIRRGGGKGEGSSMAQTAL